eukprot:symbB.v1.2.005268.t2/scaffold286.1/size306100/7
MGTALLLEDGITFLNHGAFGATLKSCLDSKRQWAEYIERQPVRFFDRALVAECQEFSVVRSFSMVGSHHPWIEPAFEDPGGAVAASAQRHRGVQRLATLLAATEKARCAAARLNSEGAAILSVTYGSTKKLLRKLAEESGFEVDEAPVDFPLMEEEAILAALESVLKPNTTLVVLDLIPSNAPFVLPPEAVALCRSKSPDAFIMLDAAHGFFGLPLKLTGPRRDYPVDAVVTNCHKWFCGAKGTALLHIGEEVQEWMEPLVISHGYGSDVPSGFYWPGLADWSSFLALDEAMAFWDLVGIEPARTYCNYMVRDAAIMLADAWGTELGIPEELLSTMALIQLPRFAALGGELLSYDEAEIVQNALYAQNIEVPVKALSGKLYVRISAHIYNHIEEYEILRDAVLHLQKSESLVSKS